MKINMTFVFSSLLLLTIMSCASMSKATKVMTPKEEYYLGRSVVANAFTVAPYYETRFATYLNTVGQFLSNYSTRPNTYKGYRFAVINSDSPLAYSSPGGHILISKGMIKNLQSEDELAAVFAHEIGHVEKQHALKTIRKSGISEMGINTGLALISFFTKSEGLRKAMDHYDELVSDYAEQVINGKYSKDQEHESDETALRILKSAGYDPGALHHYLARIKTGAGGWLSNHPSDEDRVKNLPSEKRHDPNFIKRQSRFKQAKSLL